MKKVADLTDTKFGYISVLSRNEKRDLQGKIIWNCLCDCGKNLLVQTSRLNGKNSIKSCGCKHYESLRKSNMALNQKFASYKRDAFTKKAEFTLTKDEFCNIIQSNCYYCGGEPVLWSPYFKSNGEIDKRFIGKVDELYMNSTKVKVNGIDRVDSNLGYEINNVVPCCKTCNLMKNVHSENDFLQHILKIYKFKKLEKDV